MVDRSTATMRQSMAAGSGIENTGGARRRGVIVAAIIGSLCLTACESDRTLAPSAPLSDIVSIGASEDTAAVGPALADATSRLLPSLQDQLAVGRLQTYLTDLAKSIDVADHKRAARSLALARAEVKRFRDADSDAEVGAIILALNSAEKYLIALAGKAQKPIAGAKDQGSIQ